MSFRVSKALSMPENESKTYLCSSQVETSKVGDRLMLYHRESQKALVLNPTGSLLWPRLEGPQTAQNLANTLQAHYQELHSVQALQDVSAFLDELLQHEVVITHSIDG